MPSAERTQHVAALKQEARTNSQAYCKLAVLPDPAVSAFFVQQMMEIFSKAVQIDNAASAAIERAGNREIAEAAVDTMERLGSEANEYTANTRRMFVEPIFRLVNREGDLALTQRLDALIDKFPHPNRSVGWRGFAERMASRRFCDDSGGRGLIVSDEELGEQVWQLTCPENGKSLLSPIGPHSKLYSLSQSMNGRRVIEIQWYESDADLLADRDSDGVSDAAEKWLGSNPSSRDTDADGTPDDEDSSPLSSGDGTSCQVANAILSFKVRPTPSPIFVLGLKPRCTLGNGTGIFVQTDRVSDGAAPTVAFRTLNLESEDRATARFALHRIVWSYDSLTCPKVENTVALARKYGRWRVIAEAAVSGKL